MTGRELSVVALRSKEERSDNTTECDNMPATIHWEAGDARQLAGIQISSIDVIVTSPPYWRRRDYGHEKQLGQEKTPDEYIKALIKTINNWKKILRPHASVFLNIGDSYENGFLCGIPAQFEIAARKSEWNVVNHVVWAKTIGMPEPTPYRLASRHEAVYHLTCSKDPSKLFVDLFALSQDLGQTANPGDVWRPTDTLSDVWDLYPARSRSNHLAPFPPELARRAILFACPERVCPVCNQPHKRILEPTANLNTSRPQARRALELFNQAGLTEKHLAAIRAVGISDAGKGKEIQKGSGRNAPDVLRLAEEAKLALGGYFREFTFAAKRQVGWDTCECHVSPSPGTVLDPFMGSGTTLRVAQDLGRSAIGIDLLPPEKV